MRITRLALSALVGVGAGIAIVEAQGTDPNQMPGFRDKVEGYYEAAKPLEQSGKCTNINMTSVSTSEVMDRKADQVTVRVHYTWNSSTQGSTCNGTGTRDFVFATRAGAEPAIVSMSDTL